jgi:menaquinone-specific isochorismate synthase
VYRYLLAPAANTAFIGASPERLFRATNDRVESEAVAGTVPRGQSTATDEQLARLLQESRKDNREHQFVVDGIVADLQPLSETVAAMATPQIVKLQRVQHLISPIVARLRSGVSPMQVLEALHPTPAVCGTPRDRAMLSLRQLEPFDRGYYSGPLGVILPEQVDICVALRSALIGGASVSLYAGAGIVAGSDPDIEWLELEQKLQGSLEVLLGGAP